MLGLNANLNYYLFNINVDLQKGMLRQKYFLAGIFILSAEIQSIRLAWLELNYLLF